MIGGSVPHEDAGFADGAVTDYDQLNGDGFFIHASAIKDL